MTAAAVVEQMSPGELQKLTARLEKEAKRRIEENALKHYKPYIKQLDFHIAGATYRERLLMAGNQVGKTWAAAMEMAMHVTGLYPDWWHGHRFDRPIQAWACGESNEVVRASVQKLLLGDPAGTGCIPKNTLLEVVVARGLGELTDIIKVQHVSGGVSTISLKSYAQGRERFQGARNNRFRMARRGTRRRYLFRGPCAHDRHGRPVDHDLYAVAGHEFRSQALHQRNVA